MFQGLRSVPTGDRTLINSMQGERSATTPCTQAVNSSVFPGTCIYVICLIILPEI